MLPSNGRPVVEPGYLSVALATATPAFGPPCESPSEMNRTRRRARRTCDDQSDRRAASPSNERRRSSFRPDSTKSSIARELAKAEMQALALTPTMSKASSEKVVCTGHDGNDCPAAPAPALARPRQRAATLPTTLPTTLPKCAGSVLTIRTAKGTDIKAAEDKHPLFRPDPTEPCSLRTRLWDTTDPFGVLKPPSTASGDGESKLEEEPQVGSCTWNAVMRVRALKLDKADDELPRKDSGWVPVQEWLEDADGCEAETPEEFEEVSDDGAPAVQPPSLSSRLARVFFWCGEEGDAENNQAEDEEEGDEEEDEMEEGILRT